MSIPCHSISFRRTAVLCFSLLLITVPRALAQEGEYSGRILLQYGGDVRTVSGVAGTRFADAALQDAVERLRIAAIEPLAHPRLLAKGESPLERTVLLTPEAKTMSDPSDVDAVVGAAPAALEVVIGDGHALPGADVPQTDDVIVE